MTRHDFRTSDRPRSRRRQYKGTCAITHALNSLGQRWALPILKEMQFGPRRFGQLKASITGISATMLTVRLEQLEQNGLIRQTELPPPAQVTIYELTERGLALRSMLVELSRWSLRANEYSPATPMSVASLLVSLLAAFDPSVGDNNEVQIALDAGGERFVLTIANRQLDITRGEQPSADVTIEGSTSNLARYFFDQSLETAGLVKFSGDATLIRQLPAYFPIP